MKVSSHSYDNEIFASLLNNLSDDIVLKKTAKKEERTPMSGMEVFSSTTEDNFNIIIDDELRFISDELEFAANRAKIAINVEDLKKFAAQAKIEGLRGKRLERAAQKYCNQVDRAIAEPKGTTRKEDSLINQLASSSVIPAGYGEGGPNDRATGKFMGSSKNPNTIWDSGALERFAQVKHGDEQIKASREAKEAHALAMKTAQWEETQAKCEDQPASGIVPSANAVVDTVGNQNLPANAMSMFSNDRDFESIPEKTTGEGLVKQAAARAEKVAESKDEWNKVEPAKKMNTRSAIDAIFDGFVSQG